MLHAFCVVWFFFFVGGYKLTVFVLTCVWITNGWWICRSAPHRKLTPVATSPQDCDESGVLPGLLVRRASLLLVLFFSFQLSSWFVKCVCLFRERKHGFVDDFSSMILVCVELLLGRHFCSACLLLFCSVLLACFFFSNFSSQKLLL